LSRGGEVEERVATGFYGGNFAGWGIGGTALCEEGEWGELSGEKGRVEKCEEVMPPRGERLTPEQGLLFSSSLSRLSVSSLALPYSYRHRW